MQKIQIQKLLTLTGHRDSIYTLQRAAKPNEFFSASGDGMIVSWDLNNPDTGHLIARLPNSVYALQLQANAPEILIAGQNYEGIHLLDWQNKKQIGSLQLTKAAIFDIQCREEMAFVACGDGLLAKIHLGQMQVLKKDHSANKSARAISIHTERGEVAVGYSDHFIRVFDLDSLQLKYEWQAHANSVFTVRYTPDGKLVSGSRDARLKFWDPVHEYGQLTEIVAHMYAIRNIS
jgi:WD40 repeat protein